VPGGGDGARAARRKGGKGGKAQGPYGRQGARAARRKGGKAQGRQGAEAAGRKGGKVGHAIGAPGGKAQGRQGRQGRRCGRRAWRLSAAAARVVRPGARAVRLAARATRAGGACVEGRRRGQFALRLRSEAVRLYTQVPAWFIPQRWRWTAATPTARRTFVTPLRVTDPLSIGPPTRRCMSALASRLVLRARWPDRGGRWDPGHF